MLTSLTGTNLFTGASVTILDSVYPLHKFSWTPSLESTKLKKTQAAGSWDLFRFITDMPIVMEGDIIADTSAVYWTRRKALMAVILPHPDTNVRNHIRWDMVTDEDATVYYANCLVDSVLADVEAMYPTVSTFQFQFTNNYGFWRVQGTDAIAYL